MRRFVITGVRLRGLRRWGRGPDGQEYLGARQQIVRVGGTRGDLVAIESGLKAGEQVVTAGVFKLRNGAKVMINNTVQPGANPEPKPANT